MLVKAFDTALVPHQVALISHAVALVVWDDPAERPGLLSLSIDGRPVPRPYAKLAVKDAEGRRKSLIAVRLPGDSAAASSLAIACGDEAVAEIPLHAENETAIAAAARVGQELDETSRFRLLMFLLDYCRKTFQLDDGRFTAFCRGLVSHAFDRADPMAGRARLTDRLALYVAPNAKLPANWSHIFVFRGRSIRRNPFGAQPIRARPDSAGTELALVLEAAAPGDLLLAIGSDGGACFSVVAAPERHLLDVIERNGRLAPRLERYVMTCLAAAAPNDAQSSALLRDIQLVAPRPAVQVLDPERPLGLSIELALDDGAGGIFAKGWVRDPLGAIAKLELLSPFGTTEIRDEHRHRVQRPDIDGAFAEARFGRAVRAEGFVAYLPGAAGAAPIHQYGLRATLASGATVDVTAPLAPLSPVEARDAVLGSVAPSEVTDSLLEQILAPAAAALHRAARQNRRAPELVEIGTMRRSPAVSIIIPLYRNLSFLRFQLAAFAAEPAMRDAELIYVLDSPEQCRELEHLLRGLADLYDLPLKLVVMAANAGYAAANNTGARYASGRALLLLNSDVVPERSGWLAPFVAALDEDTRVGAVGPKLLFEDGSLQHAGMYFARDLRGAWYNDHFHKGFPRDYAPASVRREVPAVTGAALLVRRSLFEEVGGFTEDFIIGDYEDSDLCLKARRAGFTITYVPTVELYHFERRSIRLHAGYTRTVAAAYNRRLHSLRWSNAMAELMGEGAAKPKPRGRRLPARAAA